MARTAHQVLQGLLALLPSGWAWPDRTDSSLAAMLLPLADAIASYEAAGEAMLIEVSPGDATRLLPDYQRVLGGDACGRDALALSLAGQRTLAAQRWTARGGQSIAYFIGLAAAMGVAITITEVRSFRAGRSRAGQRCTPASEAFTWIVTLPATHVVKFRAGASVAGERLGAFAASLVECLIRHQAPAHTTPVFSYTGAA